MSFKPAIASLSLGRAWVHQLPSKFSAAAQAGLDIEIFYEDIHYLASSYPGGATPDNILLASRATRAICDSLKLEIIGIGPFCNCEGLLSPSAKKEKLEELELWFEICRILRTDLIQIPSTFMTDGFTGDLETVARDLREIADIGAGQSPAFRFAFENLCFGTFNDTWEKAWAVVKTVDRANFGLCLDTFNIAGREYADPTSSTGCNPNAQASFKESMAKLARTIDVKKVFYVQVVDAERLKKPLVKGHEWHVDGQRPRMSWSRNARLFICEEERGGYLPVLEVLKAITNSPAEGGLGYTGWVSMELFNRSLVKKGEEVPLQHATRGRESFDRLVKAMGWETKVDVKPASYRKGSSCVKGAKSEVEISARL